MKVAKNVLNAFLNDVRATSCPDFTCPGNKPLTSEAYALLFFNGQFLLDRLQQEKKSASTPHLTRSEQSRSSCGFLAFLPSSLGPIS